MDMESAAAAGDEREIELKLLGSPKVLAQIAKCDLIETLAEGPAVTKRLVSTYYDTADFALRQAGIALRIRNKGEDFIQTLKTEGTGQGPATDRREINVRLERDRPNISQISDEALRQFVLTQEVRLGLKPIFTTEIDRTERHLATPQGDRIELAVDTGRIRHGENTAPISEIELELAKGRPAALYEVARPLVERHELRLGTESKAARGFALAEGSSPSPAKARRVRLDPSFTAEAATRAMLEAALAHITANAAPIAASDDPEAVHQMRVALRRLRAALGVLGEMGVPAALSSLEKEAKWCGRALSRARDLDVFLEDILAPVEEAFAGHDGLALLRAQAEKRRAKAWKKARSTVLSPRFTLFILDLAGALERAPEKQAEAPAPSLCDLARQILARRWKEVMERGEGFGRLSAEQYHELRIDLKKLRYAADFLSGLFPRKRVKPYMGVLSVLQDLFGMLNDVTQAEILLRDLVQDACEKTGKKKSGDNTSPLFAEAAGLVIGWHRKALSEQWRTAKETWEEFEGLTPFWQGD